MSPHTPSKPAPLGQFFTPPPRPPQLGSLLSPTANEHPSISALGPSYPRPDVIPGRRRSASVPSLPGTDTGSVQCSAMTKFDKRCKNRVKLPPTHPHLGPTPAVYCHQHKKDTITKTGFYARRPGRADRFIDFNGYIPKYLQADTQTRLRLQMEKLPTSADEPGYIYAFEIRDSKRPNVIQIKVGRASVLNKRLHQWSKACGSQEQILRGWWPRTVESDDPDASLVTGNIEPGRSGLFSHHVERLVHLELADLSVHAPYLEPGWPHLDKSDESPSAASIASASCLKKVPSKPCTGCKPFSYNVCGTIHKEIFTFQRPGQGQYKEMEWQLIVRPVIKKWGKFMEEYYA
ncbi:hypothetical protein BU15DRAFT_42400 [Melanogaster broomeanus]|nr:hypothetical protein BU15DRAFT_42400 [Melanogaster broomeanus]